MKEIKKFVSVDNKEFDNKKECLDYEEEMLNYIGKNILFTKCSDCQYHSLCKYLIEKNICRINFCDFMVRKITEEFDK